MWVLLDCQRPHQLHQNCLRSYSEGIISDPGTESIWAEKISQQGPLVRTTRYRQMREVSHGWWGREPMAPYGKKSKAA